MRVLIAGQSLGAIGGVQTYERDLATWLLGRGHTPIVYGTELGESARQLARLTIPFTDDLRSVAAPIDIIHGDSPVETMTALLHFPNTPALFVCHSWGGVALTTPHFPRILQYVAVDDTCADRLLLREAIAPEKLSVLLNAVDIERFGQRSPLPRKPRRAVVFGNLAHEMTSLPVIREACRRASLDLDVIGASAGTATEHPESIIGRYDIAFAKAKCAMEAMASGVAVILCDAPGIGGMVRSNDVDRLRRLNFGVRTLQKPLSAETLLDEIARYDADDAREVSNRIRMLASSDALHESLFALYENVIDEYTSTIRNDGWIAESRAAAVFLHDLAVLDRHFNRRLVTLAKASQRVLEMPIIGPIATRMLNWFVRRR